jgi:GntR family transcriptional regulator
VLIAINPADPRPIYVQIMDEIRRALVLRTIKPDEPLPSVRQLASELAVHPNTILQAYRELERDGVVYVRRGQGTFAAALTTGKRERLALANAVADRAVRDAYRHGLTTEELIEAIERAAQPAGARRGKAEGSGR